MPHERSNRGVKATVVGVCLYTLSLPLEPLCLECYTQTLRASLSQNVRDPPLLNSEVVHRQVRQKESFPFKRFEMLPDQRKIAACWPSYGGVWINEADFIDLRWLDLDPVQDVDQSLRKPVEDAFCDRPEKLGDKWYSGSPAWKCPEWMKSFWLLHEYLQQREIEPQHYYEQMVD